jgi:peptidoglycan/xylan/chitin deacetylase (PgdA/CDA1 family)
MSKGSMTSYHYLVLSKLNKTRLEIPENKTKAVMLSFDVETWFNSCGGHFDETADPDGEYFTYIPKLLNALDEYSIKSQFFVCGRVLEEYPEVFKQVAQKGHSLGGHGYEHELMPYYSYEDQRKIVQKVRYVMKEKLDGELKSWRCPGLAANLNTYRALKEENVTFCSNAQAGNPMNIKGIIEVPLTDKMDGKILGYNKKRKGTLEWINYMKDEVEEYTQRVTMFGMHTWLQRRLDPECDAFKQFLCYLDARRNEYWIGGFENYERWS